MREVCAPQRLSRKDATKLTVVLLLTVRLSAEVDAHPLVGPLKELPGEVGEGPGHGGLLLDPQVRLSRAEPCAELPAGLLDVSQSRLGIDTKAGDGLAVVEDGLLAPGASSSSKQGMLVRECLLT